MTFIVFFLTYLVIVSLIISKPKSPKPLAWWVQITTDNPHCTYYFGPFEDFQEANSAQYGYVEDLQHEGAENIVVEVKQCQPEVLTTCKEDELAIG